MRPRGISSMSETAVFSRETLFCGSVYHFDHSAQAVLIRVRERCKTERLFRRGNGVEHLCRPGHWPLGRNKYQPDH
jgi:hypothetical protein